MLQRLLADFRKDWEQTGEASRQYHIAFAILHGQLERMAPDKYSPAIDEFFRDAHRELKVSEDPKSLIAPNIKKSMTHGLGIVAFNRGPYTLMPEDVAQITQVEGYFGTVGKQTSEGHRIILVDNRDEQIIDDRIIPPSILDMVRFPIAYREEGSGICWVEYQLRDRPGFGSFEPASSLNWAD